MASEVAIQQLQGLQRRLRDEGVDLASLLSGADLAVPDFGNVSQRLDWPHYCAILDAIASRRDAAWFFERGAESVYAADAMLFRRGLLIGFDAPGPALRWMCAPHGPFAAVSPFLENTVEPLENGTSPDRFRVASRMRGGLSPSRHHHAFAAGVIAEFPKVLRHRRAQVDIEPHPEGADYLVAFLRPSRLSRFIRRWRRSRAAPEYLDGIGRTYLALVQGQMDLQEEQERNRRLENASARAEKQESLGQLTSGVAHDFNNILAVLQGELEMLRDDLGDTRAVEIAEMLDTCARGSDLTRRLLAYARQAPTSPESLRVQETIRSFEPLLRNGIGARVRLVLELPEEPHWIYVEKGQFENVLLNLSLNARDAMGGVGVLTISCSRTQIEADEASWEDCVTGPHVSIRVTDTGTGIPPEIASQIFDPYFTTKGDDGTGLGLAMVWGFARQAGGHVRIESPPAGGTTFELLLPERDTAAT